jgi:hypothetical protein
MIDLQNFRQIALSFPEVVEESGVDSISFKVMGRVFATYDSRHNRACLQFSDIAQDVYSSLDGNAIYPDPGDGATVLELNNICPHLLSDVLTTAYCEVAPQELADQVRLMWE